MQTDLRRLNSHFYQNAAMNGTWGLCHGHKTRTILVLIHGLFSSGRFYY